MSILGIYVRHVETTGPEASVFDVARRMRERRLGTLLVVDEQTRPVGIVSDRDVTVRAVAKGRDPSRTTVRDIMSPMPTTVLSDASIESVLGQMRLGRMRRLPVVDGMGKLIGIVSLDDILRFLAEEMGQVEELLESEASGDVR